MYIHINNSYYRSRLDYLSNKWIMSPYYNEDTVTIDMILGEEDDE